MKRAGYRQDKRENLPREQRQALRSAVRWQVFTICYTICTITIVAFVMGDSQAMKTAWFEDMLSLLPQISFLVALPFVRRRPDREHPYGWHRAMGVGHLLAGAALLGVGLHLAIDAGSGLLSGIFSGERTEIGDVEILGRTVWQGWVMVAVMVVIVIGPVWLYGPAKARLAPVLHSKLLYADADMAKADWQTNVASIVGVLGIGAGLWWLDGVAAIFIAVGIVRDGLSNCSAAVQDLMDRRARSYDGERSHPLGDVILAYLRRQNWIAESGIRLRDQGQVFHVEVFVRPVAREVSMERLAELSEGVAGLDWKVQDVVVVPADPVPDYADRLEDPDPAP
ncbi:cation transporter [Leucobacter tenebrionis]|uniref:cation transporter n=1 Tax=Leucobacter tenebrionis TaxID=2873270 RepID=UPI001CA71501|nr:cation transporter [Leucobacter tenebrionis]QZY51818.1 cation transporter [Leucobacter tenebrionis]